MTETVSHVKFTGDGLTDELRDQLIERFKKVYDPEIPVDVYELGLIYDVDVSAERNVHIVMTLTSPNCPSAEQIPGDVEKQTRTIEELQDVKVDITWEPPWDKDKMSEEALLELGME